MSYMIYIDTYLYIFVLEYGFSRCGIQSCKADRLAGRPNAPSNWQGHA